MLAAAVLPGGCASGDSDPATYVTDRSARLNAHGSAGGDETTYLFQYGMSTRYGREAPDRVVGPDFTGSVSEPIRGLRRGRTYHFRVCAFNEDGKGCSGDRTFTTPLARGSSGIAFRSNRDSNFEIYAMTANGGKQRNITNNAASDSEPAWSPDGQRIAFSSDRDASSFEIYVMDRDGSNQTNITNNPAFDSQPAWSPEGLRIAFTRSLDGSSFEIYAMDRDGSTQTNITNNAALDELPAWSPRP